MKKLLFVLSALAISLTGFTQSKGNGNAKGKGQDKVKPNQGQAKGSVKQGQGSVNMNPGQGKAGVNPGQAKVQKTGAANSKANGKADARFNEKVWAGTNDGNAGKGPIPSKNQPAKVTQSFYRDYPGATNVVWSKYRGDWTATFGTGLFGTRTAVYHANGQRRDTRSVITNSQLPGGVSVWDRIFRRDNITPASEVVVVERPSVADKIFRVGTLGNTVAQYLFYNSAGQQVQYNY